MDDTGKDSSTRFTSVTLRCASAFSLRPNLLPKASDAKASWENAAHPFSILKGISGAFGAKTADFPRYGGLDDLDEICITPQYYDDFDGDPATDSGTASYDDTEDFVEDFNTGSQPGASPRPGKDKGPVEVPLEDVIIEDPVAETVGTQFSSAASWASPSGFDAMSGEHARQEAASQVVDVKVENPKSEYLSEKSRKRGRKTYTIIAAIVLTIIACFAIGVAMGASSCSSDSMGNNADTAKTVPANDEAQNAEDNDEGENDEADLNLEGDDGIYQSDFVEPPANELELHQLVEDPENSEDKTETVTSVVGDSLLEENDSEFEPFGAYVSDTSVLEAVATPVYADDVRASIAQGPQADRIIDAFNEAYDEAVSLLPENSGAAYVRSADDEKRLAEDGSPVYQEDIDWAVQLLESFKCWGKGIEASPMKVESLDLANVGMPDWAGPDGMIAAIYVNAGSTPTTVKAHGSDRGTNGYLFFNEREKYSGTRALWNSDLDRIETLEVNAGGPDGTMEIVPLSQVHELVNGKTYHGDRVLLIPPTDSDSAMFKDLDGKSTTISILDTNFISYGEGDLGQHAAGSEHTIEGFDEYLAVSVCSSGDWTISW